MRMSRLRSCEPSSMYKRVVTEHAHKDLHNVLTYISHQLCAPQAAADFTDAVQKCYARLSRNPLIYSLCNDEQLAKKGYRKVLIKKYVLIFKVNEAKKVVTIYRLFHGAEDYTHKM